MQQVLEKLEQELKNVKRAMRLGKSALEEGLEVQQEAEELRASFSAFSEGLGGALKALREHYASLKEDDLELEKSLTKLKHAQAKIAASLSALEKPNSAQEVLEVLEGLQNSVTDLEGVLGAIASKPSQPTPQNFSTPKGAKKYVPQSKEELKKLVADESVHLGDIDISKITDLSWVFSCAKSHGNKAPAFMRKNFEGLENWDVSHATNMQGMFYRAILFNHDISSWNVSRVETMEFMFAKCGIFNQPLNSWNVSRVAIMANMFCDCEDFNQPLDNWNVSRVRSMNWMFERCRNFNQDLGNWNVSSVQGDLYGVFEDCWSLNHHPRWYKGDLPNECL
ncbi:BspA family leucine-rich repeat surface protein [Helicobacter felis]|uniref:BspA family leucine-rich repeat surface protein n=1 Tax=Helicobacter felis TaxID=214 RepID=UPI000CF086EB|nr:BspA family leucine-rich repeat surface protein [Helicobacter felis]